jgi:hypothetical protein
MLLSINRTIFMFSLFPADKRYCVYEKENEF